MLLASLLFAFVAVFVLFLAFMPVNLDNRPTLKIDPLPATGIEAPVTAKPQTSLIFKLFKVLGKLAIFNKPLVMGPIGRRMTRDLGMAQVAMSAQEFMLIKEIMIAVFLWFSFFVLTPQNELFMFSVLMGIVGGYFLPNLWLKGRMKSIKDSILRDLPDTVDLLALCVNAGLDFMMALKYVVEKSRASVIIEELRMMMQEINVGKSRRDALRDMARKYEMPDLSTFSRTLIQADRMGTSVSEALNILSEDMRETRYRRGEAMALKAPLKMLIPLLLFIFPVVAILVAGPVFLDFFQNNPLENLGR